MKKNGILTLLFAFIPGAGQMYQGYMKRGLSLVLMAAAICMASALIPRIVVVLLVVFMYSFFDTFNLRAQISMGNAGFGVVGVGVGHRLHGDRVIAADGYVADAYAAGRPASEFRKIHCFTCFSAGFRLPLPQR